MSVPTALLPGRAASGVPGHVASRARTLDRVHDHVLRVLGDDRAAARVTSDVALRAADRADDLGEPGDFETLVRLAHARLPIEERRRPDDDLAARLAGPHEPGGALLVQALSEPGHRGAALLDLTTRHGIDLRRAAGLVGLERSTAAGARTEALRQVRSRIAASGVTLDVESTLARLPLVGAPPRVHEVAELSVAAQQGGRIPPALAWLGTTAVVLLTAAAVTFGVPRLVAASTDDTAPVAVAEAVTDGPAARQLATPGDDVPEGGVEQLVVQAPVAETSGPRVPPSQTTTPQAEEQAPEPAPSEEPAPAPPEEEPEPEPSPEPTPEPSEDPLGELLPTGP